MVFNLPANFSVPKSAGNSGIYTHSRNINLISRGVPQPSNPIFHLPFFSPSAPPSPQLPHRPRFRLLQVTTAPDAASSSPTFHPALKDTLPRPWCAQSPKLVCSPSSLPPRRLRPHFVFNPKHKEATVCAACSHLHVLHPSSSSTCALASCRCRQNT
ncbi:hypothetical protein PIB30_102169 [Stylosanthes scabra]|uniref:Uncharacterized protein n=1 Tax=Stylosanthes scabra TaxID=79078 RepID=A0ABU6TX86_9FABA|nr:hypothetical protein [Stylosanthes scabra]